jgi:hypothetical protein
MKAAGIPAATKVAAWRSAVRAMAKAADVS